MRILRPLILCAILTACGGGSGGPAAVAPAPATPVAPAPPAPAATLSLSSPTLRTVAGGSAIPLTAKLSSGGTVHWQLGAGAPGALSAATGDSVRYLPPTGALAAPATVAITASGDGASATLTLAVTPDPGPPGVYLLAGDGKPMTQDGIGAAASFDNPQSLAADSAGNVYVMELYKAPGFAGSLPRLRKITPDGTVTTLFGLVNGTKVWFGQADANQNTDHLYRPRGMAADGAGNLYISVGEGTGEYNEVPGGRTGIFKITPSGGLSLLAGTENMPTPPIGNGTGVDGTGTAARFLFPTIVGIDYDDNLYVLDSNGATSMPVLTPRKVTPAGVVTTLAALPAGLNADMNGNTYRYDPATRNIVRTTPAGVTTVEADSSYCDPANSALYCIAGITPVGGATFAFISGARIYRLVVRH